MPPAPNKAACGTILVIDPDPITLLGTAGILDSAGHTCICARTAAAARRAISESPLDVVVCDVADDAAAAWQLIEELRSAGHRDRLPAVVLAGSEWAGLEQRCETAAWTRCLFKPIDPNVLIDVVGSSLWMPQLEQRHRQRGQRPPRPGWVQL
jgi:DNA-binding NtrC family response regulator